MAARVDRSCIYCHRKRGVWTAQQTGDLAVEPILPGCKPFRDNAFVPLTENQLLRGRTARAPLQHQVVQDEQYLGASRHQQDLVNL